MATITPTLTSRPSAEPGEGLCLFFYDARSEYYPGGIGNALGYTMYTGDMAFHAATSGTSNGIPRAYVGIGFDVRGNFGNTINGKPGSNILGTDNQAITSCNYTTKAPNTITTRGGEAQSYKVISTTPDLSSYPLSGSPDETYGEPNVMYDKSPPVTLHQSVTSTDDVVFNRIKVTLQNEGSRVKVEIKDPETGIYHPYQILDLDYSLGETLNPYEGITTLRAGLAFTTSDSTMNCDIKNVTVQGVYSDTEKVHTYLFPQSSPKYTMVLSSCP